ncbi:MAG TPA: sulfotransferase [Steroidobacteraceae bacterium]|jgi:tetratricopeptide (TPR) repeat protein|nr:sulfotransferase [Steroidobacteraceae bacterium]
MLLRALDTRDAETIANALADDVIRGPGRRPPAAGDSGIESVRHKLLQRVDRDARPLRFNFFKRAKLANTFKWRLLENGVTPEVADELTHALVMRLTVGAAGPTSPALEAGARDPRRKQRDVQALHARGAELLARGAVAEALSCFEQLVIIDPRNAAARNSLGTVLTRLARYREAEAEFRRAIGIRASFPEAHFNLAGVLQSTGRYPEAEMPLRRALKLKPAYLDARISLGMTSVLLGRMAEARTCYEMALRAAPRNTQALVGLGQIESLEGRFPEAEATYRRALEIDPKTSSAHAALVYVRKMTAADVAWVRRAEELVRAGLTALDEAMLRFAIGKYYDDVGDFTRAFRSYRQANELSKPQAVPYDREAHTRFVDDLVHVSTAEAIASARVGGSDSQRPVFVLGFPRSGTSLVEQIIASHPHAYGAGELDFWQLAVRRHADAFARGLLTEPLRRQLARDNLKLLAGYSADALRVVNKAPMNVNCLGLIHAVFPRARIIYMQRDPVDTCLSCYFQQFPPALNWAMDLEDLAHSYRQDHRLATHWHRVLPPGTILDVPYAELVREPERWTRRILEFLGLPWDERCLEFHRTARPVITASAWQVRQKVYRTSMQRWRNYEKFIGPLRSLADLSN